MSSGSQVSAHPKSAPLENIKTPSQGEKEKKRSEILSAGAPGHFPKMPDAELFAAA